MASISGHRIGESVSNSKHVTSVTHLRGYCFEVEAVIVRMCFNDVAQRRPLTDLAAVHDQAAAGQLPGKTILIP